MTRLMVVEEAPKNLALRSTAVNLFGHAAFREGEVDLDFAGVESMGRTFAHEYLRLKSRCPHGVAEANVPECAEKMLEIARNARPRAGRLTEKELLEEPMPLMIGM